jgi:2-polyprenyl-3-methyl-5-hydroxy-6-metoxy-1,4-benzoquinol methylase
MSLKMRDRQDEWMDQPDLDAALHAEALAGLAKVNRISGAARSIARPLFQLAEQTPGRPLRVLDVASGGGDVAIAIKRLADRRGVPIEMTGCDFSETALRYASRRAETSGVDATFVRCDAIAGELPGRFDAVYTSLFVHHLEPEQIVRLFRSMAAAADQLVIVNDLIRSTFGYLLAKWGIRILTRSKVCHVDGPLSVKAALTIPEVLRYVDEAGLTLSNVRRVFPERYVLTCTP